jgi:ribokinase
MPKKILVVGSSNVDLVLRIPRFHRPGETITGENLLTVFGGKGANQAVAAKRLGGKVRFVTKTGSDHFGETYRNYLVENGFARKDILQDKKQPTGVAFVELNPKGENRIIVSPGANGALTAKDVARLDNPWKGVGVFVTQLEIPLATVQRSLKMAKDRGAITLLNPSPVFPFTSEQLSLVDFLVPNEWEAQALTGLRLRGDHDLPKVAKKLLTMGTKNAVITLGAKGLFFKNKETEIRMRAFKVKSVDSTSAGDAFMGGLACGLSEDMPVDDTLRFASAAGALATTKLGAQPSLPSRAEVDALL